MKLISGLCIIIAIFISCSSSDSDTNPTGDSGRGTGSYWLEYAPVLSYDRHTVWLIVDDTVTDIKSGIYKVSVSNPVRERLSPIEGATFAVQSGTNVFYLLSGKLNVYNTVSDTAFPHDIIQSFNRISLANDSILIAESGGVIYEINLNAGTLLSIDTGLYPTIYKQDTTAYLKNIGIYTYELVLFDVTDISNKVSVIKDTLSFPGVPASFSIEPGYGRIAFSIFQNSKYIIYSYHPSSETTEVLAESDYRDVAILDLHTIIYSGDDGRMFRSNMDGSSIFPFWGIEE